MAEEEAKLISENDKISITIDNKPLTAGKAEVTHHFLATSTSEEDKISSLRRESARNVTNVTRRTSNSVLVKDSDGTLRVERRNSNGTELIAALQRRASNSSLPSILPLPSSPETSAPPILSAEDVLEKKGGKGAAGAFSEHLYPLETLSEKYETHIDLVDPNKSHGLTTKTAGEFLEKYGPNVLTPPPSIPKWLLFLLQFTNLLMVLLEVTALACLIIWITDQSTLPNLYIAVLLYVVIILTCYEMYSQESKGDELTKKFRALVPEQATVIRDGVMKPVPAAEIVVGDILRLKLGDKIPADCRVIVNSGMKADQSMITGESEPVEISVNAMDPNALEARNIIFNGSLVVDGGCLAVAIRTGDDTLIGSMVGLTSDTGKSKGTLAADIDYFVKVLALFSLFQAAIVFAVGCGRGLGAVDVFINGFVTIMIGNVPQGLPTTVTACLAIVAERMGRQNVYVKKLDVIETLGSCTLICTDKTGTLTMNLMSVANLWGVGFNLPSETFAEILLKERESKGKDQGKDFSAHFWLMLVATLNSRVVLERKTEDSELKPNGDASELGLYRFFAPCVAGRFGEDVEAFRELNPKVFEIPFNSAFKWQMSIHTLSGQGGKQVLLIKGAPDVLLDKCSHYIDGDGSIKAKDAKFDAIYTAAYEKFGGEGERVLGFAMRDMPRTLDEELALDPKFKDTLKEDLIGKKTSNPVKDLTFVGLVTLQDPPRKEVPKAIADCHTAGVKVVMVTGDHPLTAAAIARKIGLITHDTRDILAAKRGISPRDVPEDDVQAVVVKGVDIPEMTEEDWKVLVSKKEIVFARTSPEQKLIIVKEFTKAGNVTAMTGDGVNDSPALKQAAIGVAMGLNGSDVAREAAEIVLLDDNFASIVVGIKEGRLLFANLKKSVAYTLAHLVPEVVPVLLWAIVGIPQPMAPLLALCIDLLTELVPATSLAYEEPEALIMQVPPRNAKTDKLTSFALLFYSYGQSGMVLTGGCLLVYFLTFISYGVSPYAVFNNNYTYFEGSGSGDFVTDNGTVINDDDQNTILSIIQGSWYLMIVCGQASHIWVCRTTTVSIFVHGVFSNRITNYGVIIALGLGCLVTYTPGLQGIVGSANPNSYFILYGSLVVAFILWTYSEVRKYFSRKFPSHWLNKILGW